MNALSSARARKGVPRRPLPHTDTCTLQNAVSSAQSRERAGGHYRIRIDIQSMAVLKLAPCRREGLLPHDIARAKFAVRIRSDREFDVARQADRRARRRYSDTYKVTYNVLLQLSVYIVGSYLAPCASRRLLALPVPLNGRPCCRYMQ